MTSDIGDWREGVSASGSTMLAESREALEREQHAADVLRIRSMLLLGTVLYGAFGAVDWVVSSEAVPGWLARCLALRIAGSLYAGLVVWRLYRRPLVSPRLLAWIDASIFGLASATISVMCIGYEGIASPYASGVMLVVIVRGIVRAQHWRAGIIYVGLIGAAFPVVLLAAALFSDELRGQLHDRAALTSFTLSLIFISSAVLLLVWYGHVVWVLRRQVFESRSIGRYRLRRRIGHGAMGEVWAAYHRALQRDVAVKILRVGHGRSTEAVARFEREVRATSSLSHPNTVRVFDYGVTSDGLWYYAMELLAGQNLRELVHARGPLEPARALHVVSQAARALAEAHRQGIVHRDVKPANLFVARVGGESDFAKVLDFGIAKVEEGGSPALTRVGWVGGSPEFMSPEVAAGAAASPASDVYGLGATLYFALTGTPPFRADSINALIHAHIHAEPTPPSAHTAGIPRDLEKVVMRCLEKEPRERFADAAELSLALDGCELAGSWRPTLEEGPPRERENAPVQSSANEAVSPLDETLALEDSGAPESGGGPASK